MTTLPRRAVEHHLDRLTRALSPLQLERLRALAALIGDDGRIPLDRALAVATPGGSAAQASFRKFREAVRDATAEAGIELELVVDSRKNASDRTCWFVGADTTGVELAAMSARAADRLTRGTAVAPMVAEVFPTPAVVVYISTARGAGVVREREFVTLLREALALRSDPAYQVVDVGGSDLGRDLERERQRLRDSADVVVVLVSRAYLIDSGGDATWAVGAARRRPVLQALEALPAAPLDTPLPLDELAQRGHPFAARKTRADRIAFVDECVAAVVARLGEPPRTTVEPDNGSDVDRWMRQQVAHRRTAECTVDPQAQETDLHTAEPGVAPARTLGQRVPAVDRLVQWATDDGAPRLCALLGDVGLGKTTTARLFTEKLLRVREDDPRAPLPILFDLRDLPIPVLREGPNLRRIVGALLDASETEERCPSVDELLALVTGGGCVLIFDGLDEVLVHLDAAAGQQFTRTLWRSAESTGQLGRPRPSRLLLSCRTHYFRSIRDETVHFTGQHRDGPAARSYLALLMLPFTEEQIREYLRVNVPGADVDALVALIDGVHNLREIATRPLTLRMITEQLEVIERAKVAGREIRAVDLYGLFVEQWLERDQGKHVLTPEHKQLMMEHLAAQQWRSGARGWTVGDVEQWMLEFLAARPDLELHYEARTPGRWKDDLRTATFLVRRDDDTFAFAHTSMQEYFLARYLLRALQATDPEAWEGPVPSRETLDFLGQLLAGLHASGQRDALTALAARAAQPGPAALLAFAYGLAAARDSHPHHALSGSRLDGADLRGWEIGAPHRLDLRDLVLRGADLTGATLRDVDLRGAALDRADLTRAEIHDSDLRDADLRGARLVGTIVRSCDLDGTRSEGATLHRAQALWCRPATPAEPSGWLVAPGGRPPGDDARLMPLTGHTNAVTGGGYDPDGSRVLTIGWDDTARIWDATTGEALLTLTGHTGWATGGTYSPDGTRILTTSDDRTARIWNATTGDHQLTLTGHTDRVTGGTYSPDGTRILTTSWDTTARIWNATTGQHLLTLTGHTRPVTGGDWSPDGTRILTTSWDTTARIWNATTGDHQLTLTGHTEVVTSGTYSPDASRILTTSDDRTARIWNATTGDHQLTVTGHTDRVTGGTYSPDGTRILTTSHDVTARIWNATTGDHLLTLTGHTNAVTSGGWSLDGTRILTTSWDATAQVRDATTGETLLSFTGRTDPVTSAAYSPNGSFVLTTSKDGTARIWDATTGEALLTLTGHTQTVTGSDWSPDGTRILTTSDDGTARIWNATTGDHQLTLTGHTRPLTGGAHHPDGTRILTTSWDTTARIWDATTGRHRLTLTGHTEWVNSGAYSPDGTRILTTSNDRTARIWDATTGDHLLTLTGHTNYVTGGDWSPDGTRILTTSFTGSARVWDATTGEHLLTLTGHAQVLTCGAYSPDGTRILTTSNDRTARIWDATTGEHQLTLTGHADDVTGCAWSPDSIRILTTSDDGTARIWDATTGEPVDWMLEQLPDGEAVVRSQPDGCVIGASENAWRWLGWLVPVDGKITRLPAETFGPLPPLHRSPP